MVGAGAVPSGPRARAPLRLAEPGTALADSIEGRAGFASAVEAPSAAPLGPGVLPYRGLRRAKAKGERDGVPQDVALPGLRPCPEIDVCGDDVRTRALERRGWNILVDLIEGGRLSKRRPTQGRQEGRESGALEIAGLVLSSRTEPAGTAAGYLDWPERPVGGVFE